MDEVDRCALDNLVGGHPVEHVPEDERGLAVALHGLVGRGEPEAQGGVEARDLPEAFDLALHFLNQLGEEEFGVGIVFGRGLGSLEPALEFIEPRLLVLEKPVGRPDTLKAEDGFAVFPRIEPAAAEFQREALECHQLDEVAHPGKLVRDEPHGRLVLVVLQQRVELQDDRARAVFRDHPRLDALEIRGGLFVFPIEEPRGADEDFRLGDLQCRGVLLDDPLRAGGEEREEFFQCGPRLAVVFFLHVGDAQPEQQFLDLRRLERRLLFEGGLDRADRVAEFFHVDEAHGVAVTDAADRLGRLLRLAEIRDQLLIEIGGLGIFSAGKKPFGVRVVFLRGEILRWGFALCHALCGGQKNCSRLNQNEEQFHDG